MNRYPWILTRPVKQRRSVVGVARPTGQRSGRFLDRPCRRCGYDPVGFRRTCPACLVPVACNRDGREQR